MRRLVFGAALVAAMAATASAADLDNGKSIFNKCRACHQIGENAKNMVGPVLNGLFGRKAGSIEGFNYSEANKTSGITWNDATFAEYIKNPMQRMPGTRMAFAGVRDEKDIANLWAWLKQFNENGDKK